MRFSFTARQSRLTKSPRRKCSSRQIGRGFEQLENRRMLSTIPVSLTTDAAQPTDLDNGITLREAILYVNGDWVPPGDRELFDYTELGKNDTILFDSNLDGETIVLSAGELEINRTVVIDATDLPNGITIDANDNSCVFAILLDDGALPDPNGKYNVTLAGLTITGGKASDKGGGIFYYSTYEYSTLSIIDSTIEYNEASNEGGGICVWSDFEHFQFELTNSIVANNSAGKGGGLYWYPVNIDQSATIEDCTFQSNTATYDGGGIGVHMNGCGSAEYASLTLKNSTVSGNTATNSNGGGVWFSSKYGTFNCVQSTISGNYALWGAGGGLWLDSTYEWDKLHVIANIKHTTITNNHSPNGGGLYGDDQEGLGMTTTLNHTIVSGNDDGSINLNPNNIAGAIDSSSSYNLIGNGSVPDPGGVGNIYDNDPGLSDLGYYGGPTQTHMPIYEPGNVSPVIDAGNSDYIPGNWPVVADYTLTADQRGPGFIRIYDAIQGEAQIDIGAVEYRDLGDTPRILDVRLDGSSWTGLDAYSFYNRVAAGEQLRPIATQGVDTLIIQFSEDVTRPGGSALNGSELVLAQTVCVSGSAPQSNELHSNDFTFSYNPLSFNGKWTFNSSLADGKYAIHLASDQIVNGDDNTLDGEWDNPTNGTPDDYTDDKNDSTYKPTLVSGSGTPGSTNVEFRFHFALLAGDSDGDGIVEAETGEADDDIIGDVADIDGDGVAGTQDDIDLAINDYNGNYLPLKNYMGGDFVDNEKVDAADLAAWIANFEKYNVSGVPGDADGDGDCDGNDFLLWQISFGSSSVWYISSAMGSGAAGSGYPIIGPDVPQIENVIISGSLSQHGPYSFADALYNGQPVIGSGYQLVTVPVGGADTITIVFSEAVNISASSLDIVGLTTANEPTLAEFAYDVSTHTASWRFEGWALGDRYLLMVSEAVTDVDGNLLDGEWVNPASMTTVNAMVSEFPSGDGDPGGNFHFLFTLLPGDANLDLKVDIADYAVMSINWGLGIGDLSALFSQGDFSGDGMVTGADLSLLLINFNRNLQDTWLLADFDGDFDVDDDDLAVISANAGMTGATWEDGDLNGDGEVTVEDFDLALALFGLDLEIVS